MPQEKSETGLLVLGFAALAILFLRSRTQEATVAGGTEGFGEGFAMGPPQMMPDSQPLILPSLPPPPMIQAKPMKPFSIGGVPISGLFGEPGALGLQIPGIRTITSKLAEIAPKGISEGEIVRKGQPEPKFIPISEFEQRFPHGITTQKTPAVQFGEAVFGAIQTQISRREPGLLQRLGLVK